MACNLYRIEMFGMKNIQDLITIDFTPASVKESDKKNISKVKAIYGANGSGKSAIMNAIYLYKNLCLDSSLLKQTGEKIKLNKIINKLKKEFYISFVYGIKNVGKTEVYKNELKIKIDDDVPYIESEKFYVLKDKSINGEYNLIYEVNNGELNINEGNELEINIYFKNRTLNILKYSTCTSMLNEVDIAKEIMLLIKSKNFKIEKLGIVKYLLINSLFSDSLTVYLEETDLHKERESNYIDEMIYKGLNVRKGILNNNSINSKRDIVSKNRINDYKKNIERLTKFLLLFKPNLKNIRLEITEDETYYYCNKKMVYDGYEVDSDYESTGIQKLMSLYNSIEDITKNKIVFIDELDANINGVYLSHLIKYINELKKGQLCFTSHNLYPMQYLCSFTNSIDFLGETGKLVSWKKNGNYKPYNQYPEGMIYDSPFNISSIDFEDVFEEEE